MAVQLTLYQSLVVSFESVAARQHLTGDSLLNDSASRALAGVPLIVGKIGSVTVEVKVSGSFSGDEVAIVGAHLFICLLLIDSAVYGTF